MTDPTPLDPDQVQCRRCHAPAGSVCLTPSGAKSRTVHMERRRDAAAGKVKPDEPRPKRGTTRRTRNNLTDDGRSKGGKVAAQNRRRRRAEAEAKVAAELEAAERKRIEEEAVRLADDALRFTNDRAILKRQTLDAAMKAATRLVESLDHLKRPAAFDDDGNPRTKPVELFTVKDGRRVRVIEADGTPAIREDVDVVGYYSPDTVERLAKVAASTLNSLRLEEGKATGIEERRGPDPSEILGETGVDELLAWADRNLPRGGAS